MCFETGRCADSRICSDGNVCTAHRMHPSDNGERIANGKRHTHITFIVLNEHIIKLALFIFHRALHCLVVSNP